MKSLVAILLIVLITLTGCGSESKYQGTLIPESELEFDVDNYIDDINSDLKELSESQNHELDEGIIFIDYNDVYEDGKYYTTRLTVEMIEHYKSNEERWRCYINYDVTPEGLVIRNKSCIKIGKWDEENSREEYKEVWEQVTVPTIVLHSYSYDEVNR